MTPLKPGHISPTPEEAAEIDAAIASDPDTWELTEEDFARMTPAMDNPFIRQFVKRLEAERNAQRKAEREAQRRADKTRVTIRLDSDIVDCLRAGGPGWQTRANDMLRHAVLGA